MYDNPTNCARWQFVASYIISLPFIAQYLIDKKLVLSLIWLSFPLVRFRLYPGEHVFSSISVLSNCFLFHRHQCSTIIAGRKYDRLKRVCIASSHILSINPFTQNKKDVKSDWHVRKTQILVNERDDKWFLEFPGES